MLFGDLTFLKGGSGDLPRVLSVAHDRGAGPGLAVHCSSAAERRKIRNGGKHEKTLLCSVLSIQHILAFQYTSLGTERQDVRQPTLLVTADVDLRVSLHVHHDTALPVSLGVDRHRIACST